MIHLHHAGDSHASSDTSNYRWPVSFILVLSLLFIIVNIAGAQSQSDLPSYWQYSASGRLNDVLPVDINFDGVSEYLLVDENNHIDLITAEGQPSWTYEAPGLVSALDVIDLAQEGEPSTGIVIGLPNLLILLSADGEEIWRSELNASGSQALASSIEEDAGRDQAIPIDIKSLGRKGIGQSEFLVLLRSGELIRYDAAGNPIWRHNGHLSEVSEAPPQILVLDLDQDGEDEIVLAVFNPRRFGQVVLIDDDRVLWDLSLSRSVTDLEEITFRESSQPLFAVSTTSGHISVYDYLRRRHWLRTLNTPVTSLAEVQLPGQAILVAGTESGATSALNEQGRRLWTTHLSEDANQAVVALSATDDIPLDESNPVLAATIASPGDSGTADALLLDGSGRIDAKISDVDIRVPTQIIDSNQDQNDELLVPRFASLELLGLGVGNSTHVQEWEYSLNAAPGASLVADLNSDGKSELVIGTLDGRVHSLNDERVINWLFDTGGAVQSIALLEHFDGENKGLLVAGNSGEEAEINAGWIQLREPNGERVWDQILESPITTVTTADLIPGGDPEIIAGTSDGKVVVLSSLGEILSETTIFPTTQAVNTLVHTISANNPSGMMVAVGDTAIAGYDVSEPESTIRQIASFPEGITGFSDRPQQDKQELSVRFVAATSDGLIHAFDGAGTEITEGAWPLSINAQVDSGTVLPNEGPYSVLLSSDSPLLLGTQGGDLIRLDISVDQATIPWLFQRLGNITDVHWYDQDDDGNPEIAVAGNRDGRVVLYEDTDGDAPSPSSAPLELASAVFSIDMLSRDNSPLSDLLVVGENGLVQLLRDQENRPPLLTNPVATSDQGQYIISVNLNDAEGDEVVANLEIFDPETSTWEAQGAQLLADGGGTLFWTLASPPENPLGLQYRFVFSDGSYTSTMTPPVGPISDVTSPFSNTMPLLIVAAAVTGLILIIVYLRQAQTPHARATRFYQQLQENPSRTLVMLEQQVRSGNAPDLMPHLASHARRTDDRVINSLADAIFLLPDQPLSGMPILNKTLVDLSNSKVQQYDDQERWQNMAQTTQTLLEASSVTDLSLLRPQLEELTLQLDDAGIETNAFHLLEPVLSNLQDSERVDLAEDRLVYLNEAAASLKRTQRELLIYAPSVEHHLVSAITRRWSGLVSAEISDLLGRAELAISLKTRRLVPGENITVVMDVRNNGRAVAENIVAMLDESPAYLIHDGHQEIVYLAPGRQRELEFTITPQVDDRFRISMSLMFNDHNEENRTAAFGDMVHMLPPARDFDPIKNPYTPGTPLRQNSLLFFGREALFDFIAENAGRRSHRNALILVGQRRTGKTSALLRLGEHLPPELIPVYVDSQSLGVVPGMPALLEELAWLISDALLRQDIKVEVPELESWQKDPTRLFQRHYLPQVAGALPEGTTILLVFDEFEAFETLVAEGILPPTFFTYLRHLMQHSEQLSFIFVGTRRLEEMTSDYWSVLFNIALYRKIGFLDDRAAMQLISDPVLPNLIYDDLALDKILRVTAGQPYFLQLVCYTLVKHANLEKSGYVTISNLNAAIDEMLSLGEVHFAYIWQRSTLAERAILVIVAHLMDYTLPFHSEEIVQKLKEFDIILDPTEVTNALNSLVERDVLREVTLEAKSLYEVKLGLVCSWVARNKSISKLYAGKSDQTGNGQHQGKLAQK